MKLIRLTIFSAKLLIGFWILDVFIAAQTPNSIFIMSNTHEFFPDIIHKRKCDLLISTYSFLNVALSLCCTSIFDEISGVLRADKL